MPRADTPIPDRKQGFDITAVIGRVEYGGAESAYQAAMKLIAENSQNMGAGAAKTTYHFPGVAVTVEHAAPNVGVDIDTYADMDD